MTTDTDTALQTFIDESHELLVELEAGLLKCERNTGNADTINSIFRVAHTIKGSSGLFGLDAIVSFVHVVETALDRVRIGKVPMDSAFAVLLLSCKDHIGALVAAATGGSEGSHPSLDARSAELSILLQAKAGAVNDATTATSASGTKHDPRVNAASTDSRTQSAGGHWPGHWHISARFKPDVLRGGMDPLSFIRYLTTFGEIKGIAVVADALPPADGFDPETCYLGFELAFASETDEARIRAAFEFVCDDCVLQILPPHAPPLVRLQAMPEFVTDRVRAAEILLLCGSLTQAEAQRELQDAAQESGDSRTQPDSSARAATPQSDPGKADLGKADPGKADPGKADPGKRQTAAERSVRVDASKLDHLINLVGELIIAAAGANLGAKRIKNIELQESTSRLSELVEAVRDSTLQLRMVKIGATFSRFQRVVNDVSRELGKDIQLVVSGEDTELDKTVVEKIADPLTHLVRNAIDHGIEPGETRAARGKSASGTIRLNAYHDSGSIVIEVSDDGGGLNRERILAKAIERGMIEPGKNPGEQEVFGLIFEPGFSTAAQVTNLSGRGVGMDVVKRNITALRGSISIDSAEGVGTTVAVRLPLTLAIINGFLVGLGKSVFVVPLEMVEECVEFSAEPGQDYANLRGQALPFVRLRDHLNVKGSRTQRENIVIVNCAGQRAGLVVDTLLGEFQTVIKPLGRIFNAVSCISGSTILGNGEVALILDVPALVQSVAGTATAPRAALAESALAKSALGSALVA